MLLVWIRNIRKEWTKIIVSDDNNNRPPVINDTLACQLSIIFVEPLAGLNDSGSDIKFPAEETKGEWERRIDNYHIITLVFPSLCSNCSMHQ